MNILCIFYILYILIFPGLLPSTPSNFHHLLFPFPGKIQGFKLSNAKLIFLENKKSKLLFLSTGLPRIPLYMKCMSLRGEEDGGGGNFQRTLAILLFSLVCWWAKGNPYFCAKNNFKINRINLSLHIHCTVQMSFLKMKDGEERK